MGELIVCSLSMRGVTIIDCRVANRQQRRVEEGSLALCHTGELVVLVETRIRYSLHWPDHTPKFAMTVNGHCRIHLEVSFPCGRIRTCCSADPLSMTTLPLFARLFIPVNEASYIYCKGNTTRKQSNFGTRVNITSTPSLTILGNMKGERMN